MSLTRGDVWTVSGGADYSGKPRPAIVVQSDDYPGTASVVVVLITSSPTEAEDFRFVVEPSAENGLKHSSHVMIDKVAALPKSKLGKRIGALSAADTTRLNRALLVFMGLAG
jgi:mRNA interferase MazF